MNRRNLLAAGMALSVPFAGYGGVEGHSSDVGSDAGRNDLEIPDTPEKYPVNDGDLSSIGFDPERRYRKVEIGSRETVDESYRPHGVRVWNAAAESEITVQIIDFLEDSVVYNESHAVPNKEEIVLLLLEPSMYILRVRVSTENAEHTLRVPCSFFDCNTSSTRIGVFSDRTIKSSVVSTLAGCPSHDC